MDSILNVNVATPNISKNEPYNPLIANAFFRSGQIEAWGRGIEKITNACKEWNKPAPFYKVSVNEVMIGFDADVAISSEFGDKFGDKFGKSQIQARIVEIMRVEPTVSAREIAESLNITSRAVEKNIQEMKKLGIIERIGSPKGGHWTVVKRG